MEPKSVPEILKEGAETYELKNSDYGASWQLNGKILFRLVGEEPVVLETVEDWIAVGLFTRRLDKLARSVNGELRGASMNYEKAADADTDESVYAAMQAVNKMEREKMARQPVTVDPPRATSNGEADSVGVGDE